MLELKLRRGPLDEPLGLQQLARYLDRLGLEHGYLLLFEIDCVRPWDERLRWETHQQDGKRIIFQFLQYYFHLATYSIRRLCLSI